VADPRWLEWGKRLQTLSQNGLAYNSDPFNQERYAAIRQIAAEIMGAHFKEPHDGPDATLESIAALFEGEVGHATPKIDVRGVVFRDRQILLVKERSDGLWSLPGGWADVYDSPADAVVREVLEESGYTTRAVKLLGLLDRAKQGHPPAVFHSYKAFFRCDLLGGEPHASVETDEIGFFPEDALPRLSIDRVTPGQIARFFVHLQDPDLPTDFD
jgi:ADP-ribose pyrophosphatase YjhB (NUDIX family)